VDNDEDYLYETIETLEHLSMTDILKDKELDVVGELLSNLYGSIEVFKEIKKGKSERDALNGFMQRVIGTIDS
tara:strand:- start:675 stop:893 length:219 start_codon:yes stop_codon:yes gene_type:complete